MQALKGGNASSELRSYFMVDQVRGAVSLGAEHIPLTVAWTSLEILDRRIEPPNATSLNINQKYCPSQS